MTWNLVRLNEDTHIKFYASILWGLNYGGTIVSEQV